MLNKQLSFNKSKTLALYWLERDASKAFIFSASSTSRFAKLLRCDTTAKSRIFSKNNFLNSSSSSTGVLITALNTLRLSSSVGLISPAITLEMYSSVSFRTSMSTDMEYFRLSISLYTSAELVTISFYPLDERGDCLIIAYILHHAESLDHFIFDMRDRNRDGNFGHLDS